VPIYNPEPPANDLGKCGQPSIPTDFPRADFPPNATIVAVMTIMFTLFDTAIGRRAITRGGRGITGVKLPEASETKTRAWLLQRFLGARKTLPPPYVARSRRYDLAG
jgi:hypothetical protein